MSALIIIPARYASSRYPGKPLVELADADGVSKSLIRRSWDTSQAVKGVDRVIVATDDERIADHCRDFGAEVVMTPDTCRNGTERCAAALEVLGKSWDVVINLQGDAPLTPPWFVEALLGAVNADTPVATPVLRCDAAALNGFLDDRAAGRVGGTTAVFDNANRALYFSKEVIPFTPKRYETDELCPVFHHVGVYAYTPAALAEYVAAPEGTLEGLEGLEQLRFLEMGVPIACVEVDARGRVFWELNNPVDVARIEAVLAAQGMP